jgi:U3 small nucleolar RNA-associated protein 20
MKSEFPEDDDIQRVPIALAIIKLLKSMNTSDDILESNLPSVFLRLCQFLQSRTQSIRESARNTFVKVMQCLGPHYFKYALNEMRATLSRGYQRHVFIYTVHAILSNLISQLRSGDLDNCLDSLIEICNLELFGSLAEEKDVSQITTKLKEAKKCKSYEIYQILGRFVSENNLTQLVIPLKTVLSEAHSYKVVRKVSQTLSKVGQGLISNKDLSEKTIMLFIYGVINNVIPHMQLKTSQIKKEKFIKKKPQKPDSYLIPKQSFQRIEKVVKINEASNAHIIVEFALNCFQALMKQNRMQSSNEEHLSLLDPYIPLLENLLDSKDSKLTTVSLQCLHSLYTKFSILPSFTKQSEKIIEKIFLLLHKYAGLGMSDSDNVQLVLLCFKTISLFIKDRTDVKISDDQMAVLLSYIDQDLNDDTRQSTAFVLLKSILSRKYNSPVLHRIMKKLSEMSIICEIDHIRNNCLHLCIKYLTEYPNGNRLKRQISFFIRHLEYEKATGRESVVNLLKSLISSLSYEFLSENIGLIFVPLSSRLLNESSSDCKKLVADSIVILLKRLKEEDRNKILNEMIIPWLQEEGALERHIASHLCSLFINVEEKNFTKRFLNCLPFIKQQLDPDRYETSQQNSDNALVKVNDSLVYQHLNVILKLMRTDSNLMDKNRRIDDINSILEYIQSFYLLHPHIWVRVISTQIFGQLFSQYSIECLANAIKNPSESNAYLLNNTNEKLIQLCSKFCLMFRDIYEAQALSDQLIKNLVYIARVIILASDQNQTTLTLKWMTNKLMFEVKYELKTNPNLTKKRICVFKWMAAVAVELGSERLETYLPNFLPPLCREDITGTKAEHNLTNEENELSILTKQVIQLIKNIVGSEKFTHYYTEARTKLTLKRLERKKNRALEV